MYICILYICIYIHIDQYICIYIYIEREEALAKYGGEAAMDG